jgi:hypothetical protein
LRQRDRCESAEDVVYRLTSVDYRRDPCPREVSRGIDTTLREKLAPRRDREDVLQPWVTLNY